MRKDITPFLIKSGITVKEAMNQLDSSHRKVVFLIDENQRLKGSLTDGDIRRWILAGGHLDVDVIDVCYADPYWVGEEFNREAVKKEILKGKYPAVPVINLSGEVVDILFWDDVFQGTEQQCEYKKLDNPVVIMAGGQGTRLEPFTKILPKPLIPIGDKSIIEIIIDKFLPYQIHHFHISVNHKAKIIKSYFEELSPPYTIDFIEETIPLGTIGALSYLKGKVDRPLIVTNCDIIIDTNYSNLLDFHHQGNYDITLVASMMNHKIPYGICEIESGGTLTQFREKPEFSFLASVGMYIISPAILEMLPHNTFCHITHLIELVRENERKVGVFPIGENAWFDTGEWHEYKKTLERLNV